MKRIWSKYDSSHGVITWRKCCSSSSTFSSSSFLTTRTSSLCITSNINTHSRSFSASRVTRWEWPVALQTIIAAMTSAGSVVAWQWNRSRRLKKTFIKNVMATLERPFVPPFHPKYGPVFHRKVWEHDFIHMCDTDIYAIVHGASQVGISLAVVQSLKDRRGVVYLNLRGAEPQKVAQRLAAAIGYTGNEMPQGGNVTLDTDSLMMVFGDAAKKLKAKGIKPVVVIEDIHYSANPETGRLPPANSVLACALLDLYIGGYVNTIYTANDFSAIKALSAESGHSRLRPILFHQMPDNALREQLGQLAMAEIQPTTEDNTQTHPDQGRKFTFLPRAGSAAVATSGYKFVLNDGETNLIVEKLGSHMGDVIICLRNIIEEGKTAEESIETIVHEQMMRFYTAFPEEIQQQKPEYVVASDRVLYALTHKTDEKEELLWAPIHEQVADLLTFGELVASVNHLVKRSIVSYVDPETICFHSRALKWAYQRIGTRETWKRTVNAAVADCRKKHGIQDPPSITTPVSSEKIVI